MLRSLFALLVALVATPVIALGAMAGSLLRGREIDMAPAGLWGRLILAAAGVRVEEEGLEHAARPGPCVFACNHQSNADIWVVARSVPRSTKFVSKESLFSVPFMGWAMRRAGFIPIDRGNRKRAIRSLGSAVERIRGGCSVIVFPEGTRSRDGRLQPFKKGPFHLAAQAGVPLVPVVIEGSFELLPPGSWRLRSGTIRLRFLPPIDPGRYAPDDVRGLLEETHRRMAAALEETA
jgi:1-acyl-sn-glycerol-3-phosphate acyltransferase